MASRKGFDVMGAQYAEAREVLEQINGDPEALFMALEQAAGIDEEAS